MANHVNSPKAPVLKKLALGTQGSVLYDTRSVPLRERRRLLCMSTPVTSCSASAQRSVAATRPPRVRRPTSEAIAVGMLLIGSGARSVKLSITWSASL